MRKALEVYTQYDGEVTKAYYAELAAIGPLGEIAVALFRAQKRSSRAKTYRRSQHRRNSYDVKSWSLSEVCRLIEQYKESGITYGWKQDHATVFGNEPSWVLYVDLPEGQVSFYSPDRGKGPEYEREWDGQKKSADRIIQFCDSVAFSTVAA